MRQRQSYVTATSINSLTAMAWPDSTAYRPRMITGYHPGVCSDSRLMQPSQDVVLQQLKDRIMAGMQRSPSARQGASLHLAACSWKAIVPAQAPRSVFTMVRTTVSQYCCQTRMPIANSLMLLERLQERQSACCSCLARKVSMTKLRPPITRNECPCMNGQSIPWSPWTPCLRRVKILAQT